MKTLSLKHPRERVRAKQSIKIQFEKRLEQQWTKLPCFGASTFPLMPHLWLKVQGLSPNTKHDVFYFSNLCTLWRLSPFPHSHFRFLITQKSWAQNGAQSRAGEISASAIVPGLTFGLVSWTDRTQAIKTRQGKARQVDLKASQLNNDGTLGRTLRGDSDKVNRITLNTF